MGLENLHKPRTINARNHFSARGGMPQAYLNMLRRHQDGLAIEPSGAQLCRTLLNATLKKLIPLVGHLTHV